MSNVNNNRFSKLWLALLSSSSSCHDSLPQGYLSYIRSLPINDTPEIFGLHDNANISFAQNETFALLGAVARLQPRAGLAGGKTDRKSVV